MAKTSDKKSNGDRNGTLKRKLLSTTEKFEEAISRKAGRRAVYILRLYVTGSTPGL